MCTLTSRGTSPRRLSTTQVAWAGTSERKMIVMHQEAVTAFSKDHNVFHLDPFLEPRFVAAYARMVAVRAGNAQRCDARPLCRYPARRDPDKDVKSLVQPGLPHCRGPRIC
jgi:hypothetical protein